MKSSCLKKSGYSNHTSNIYISLIGRITIKANEDARDAMSRDIKEVSSLTADQRLDDVTLGQTEHPHSSERVWREVSGVVV